MFVLVQDAPEAITSVGVQVGDPMGVGDRFGQRGEWSGVRDALMRPVPVVEDLELAQGVQQVSLVEDQRPVEQLAAAGPHPPFHDRVHPRHPHAAAYDLDTSVGKHLVEQVRVLAVPIPNQVLHPTAGVLQVHHEDAGGILPPVPVIIWTG